MIHYIAQYSESEDYNFSPGGVSKMSYFLYCLQQLNLPTKIFSCVTARGNGIKPQKNEVSKYGFDIHYAASIYRGSKLLRILNILMLQLQLFFYLIRIPSTDTIYIYHERFYAPVIKIIRKIKKVRIVCDVEEIYTIHAQYPQKRVNKEISYLKGFKYFTIAGKGLAELLSLNPGQYALCCGVYAPIMYNEEKHGCKTKILYAGTFDTTKGGAFAAVECMQYLDEDYHLIVCGFGNENQVEAIKNRISVINNDKKYDSITYLGYVHNGSSEYVRILRDCTIGLSTQNPAGAFNNTSFPSKIFEYMRYGLRVVSTRIRETSNLPVTDYITFIKDYSPKGIAVAIAESAEKKIEAKQSEVLSKMHEKFCIEFKNLLTGINVVAD